VIRISEHAIDRYLERVNPCASRDEARTAIDSALCGSAPKPVPGTHCVLVPVAGDMLAVVTGGTVVTLRKSRMRSPRGGRS
jgi:hypothetical protein